MIITISRMFGSGGSEIAGHVAATLGWQLLDNDLVDAVAQRLGVSADEVAAREERVPTMVQRLADALALSAPEAMPPMAAGPLPPSDERIVEVTALVIREAVARGHAVIVGRGAQSMLAESGDALHVFCYAPRVALVARTSARTGLGINEAAKLVDETNRHREQYVRTHWRRGWRDFDNYHVLLNTEWLGLNGAAELIVHVARERFSLE